MPNLKPYYDAAIAADAEVKRILNEMDGAFNNGTPEGKEKALSLRPALEEAKTKAEEANRLYVSMRDASLVNDQLGSLFTMPPDSAQNDDPPQGDKAKVINRAGFTALNPRARIEYVRAGGKIVDD